MVPERNVLCMVDQTTTTTQVDENGRLTIPKGTREALDLIDTRADLKLEIDVLRRNPEGDNEE